MCPKNDIVPTLLVAEESAADMRKRLNRERYRAYYQQSLDKARQAALDRYYRKRATSDTPPRPVRRPRKYESVSGDDA